MRQRLFALSALIIACVALSVSVSRSAEQKPVETAAFAPVTAKMKEFVAAKQTAGAVTLVMHRGKIVHLAAVGSADVEQNKPMQVDALFGIASMTKPIAATAVLILQDEGKLSIEDPVSKYVPEFKDAQLKSGGKPAREVTIRDLLTHTSGLGGSQAVEGSLKDTAVKLAKGGLDFEPGSKWQYSPALNVCGRIVEVVSGKPFDVFVTERIFRPCQMVDSTFYPTASQKQRVAKRYQPTTDKTSIEPTPQQLIDAPADRAPSPSGGLFSTAADMGRFYQMILNGGEIDGQRVVSKAAVEQMTRIQTADIVTGFTPGNGWGLGWCVVREPQGVTKSLSSGSFGHGGAHGTQGWVDPQRQMIFVLMIQRSNFGNSDGADLRGSFQDLAVKAVGN